MILVHVSDRVLCVSSRDGDDRTDTLALWTSEMDPARVFSKPSAFQGYRADQVFRVLMALTAESS